MLPKITKVESARHMDGEGWALGKEIIYNGGLFVTEIKDMSVEFENGVHVQYDIFINGKLYKSLVNMPVKVEYSIED